MRIQTSDIIAGQPALAIRKLLQNRDGTIDIAVESLHTDYATAKQALHDLSSEEYIKFTDTQEDQLEWKALSQLCRTISLAAIGNISNSQRTLTIYLTA